MPTLQAVLKDNTSKTNVLSLIKGLVSTGVATIVPTAGYSNTDAYPNCRSYVIQNYPKGNTGGYIFFSDHNALPDTAGIALSTGASVAEEAPQNSYSLADMYISTDTANTIVAIKWSYT